MRESAFAEAAETDCNGPVGNARRLNSLDETQSEMRPANAKDEN